MKRFDLKRAFGGGGNGVNLNCDEVLGCYGHSEGDGNFMPEELYQQKSFSNNAIFRFAQDDETNPVIVSESETIQSIDNQNQLQGNKYAPTSKSKISVLPQGVDMRSNSLAPCGRGQGEGLKAAFTKSSGGLSGAKDPLKADTNDAILRGLNNCSPLNDRKNYVSHWKNSRKIAFTLAETLITLGIIGVVAAMTLPTVINKCQSYILKQQFRKAYSTFYNAIKLVQVQNGSPIACYYWEKNPYEAAGNQAVCLEKNEFGTCKKYSLKDGSSLPNDYNGAQSECQKFSEDLMKTLKVVKFCEKEALKNGCLTENYRGVDKVKKEENPNVDFDPNYSFGENAIKKYYPVFITSDGALYIRYGNMSERPNFALDVNGHKGPNKWGYDIFTFRLTGNKNDGITKINPATYAIEKGGKSMEQMMKEF